MIAILLPFVAPLGLQAEPLTDAALTACAAAPWDHREKMFKHEVLGMHHGATVVADFPCSDLCPDYTVRRARFLRSPSRRERRDWRCYTPPEETRERFAAVQGPRSLWIVDGLDHGAVSGLDRPLHRARIPGFLGGAIGRP